MQTYPSNGSSEFIRHEPCLNCGSSDANSVYSDGHTYCFVCHKLVLGDGQELHTNQMSNHVELKGSAGRLQKRNITEKTCELYKIYRDGELLQFPYFSSDGVLLGKKIRTKQKDFRYEGISTDTLFGQHRFPTTGKRIVIT